MTDPTKKNATEDIDAFLRSINKKKAEDKEARETAAQEAAKEESLGRRAWSLVTDNALSRKVGEVFTAARRFNKAYDAVADIAKTIHDHSGPIGPMVKGTASGLKKAFMWAAFEKDDGGAFKRDEDGDLVFSKGQLSRRFAAAAGVALAVTVAAQGAYFYGTQFEETVYTTGKQEIETGQLYQFSGCNAPPCSTQADNGKFYEIEQSFYLPRLIYPEEDVFANIPQQDAVCQVKGYGVYFKQLKLIHKQLEWYQKVYDVSCRPLSLERDGTIPKQGLSAAPMAAPAVAAYSVPAQAMPHSPAIN